jgi:uncharacterized protein YabN with tetrapyrrole methylase and pyrophosphatase domain
MIDQQLVNDIRSWGIAKGILKNSYPEYLENAQEIGELRYAQWRKTEEEVEELYDAVVADDRDEAKDAIGDIIVTLIMQADLWDTDVNTCLQQAYDVISKRTGKMVDGQFVKDGE